MDLEPGAYKVVFDGAEGSGSFALKRKGRIYARGKAFEKLLAMSSMKIFAAERLAEVLSKNKELTELTQAEARVRRLVFDSRLTEHEAA